jgi:hypothetical protein
MKKLIPICAVIMMMLAVGGVANAANITDAIKIERSSAPDTFTVSFLYNTNIGDADEYNWYQWDMFDLLISAEPIIWRDPLPGEVIERLLTPGEILVGTVTDNGSNLGKNSSGSGNLFLGGYDWSSFDPPYQAVQIYAFPEESGTFPTNTPLFSFIYTGSATEFVIYDGLSVGYYDTEAGRIPVPEPTTAITLASFEAKPGKNKVTLIWKTATEIDNAGFNILRAESENGVYIKINDAVIPAKAGGATGASYQFIDTNAKNRTTYYYKLEDIDLNGTSTMHGPVSATPKFLLGILKK